MSSPIAALFKYADGSVVSTAQQDAITRQRKYALLNQQMGLQPKSQVGKRKCRLPECDKSHAGDCATKTMSPALINEGYCVDHALNLRWWTKDIYGKLYYKEEPKEETK